MSKISRSIRHLLDAEKMTGSQLALDLNVSEQMVSHMKNDRRKMPFDVAEAALRKFDQPFFAMGVMFHFSDGCAPPVFSGDSVERHRLAFEEIMVNEAQEVIRTLHEVSFVKNPKIVSVEEKERVKEAIKELLDVEAWAKNLAALLCKEYGISLKECYRKRGITWKARGWVTE
ncbi:helix-turn-helix transcriptional regulator [Bacillus swezeyi]|uniref:Transcriptional regulator n=1 Tax=Bacillus swezeyi TaxID=1925020 RepID=A0A1R1QPV8_9BACI|nr:helix-turn-helix transcriptional regulator [Bacillus swezeyi]MEC1261461.1 helix-turn-helix transcriptional regulator [Bacillus swezeyi]MED2926676.1 helix-turn-helix transcriptional regulator [Bacillus swezeyi]MED2944149.1 helix-turn-helix transcriptional regulator [Bacillus swezeyi]MED2965762.1 helix-turn-helix transcriptional regulator [Bacillus swezeyi]MED3070835.1 helix-turn-helix transcriptional regulator [Bacillus swezeyi]